MHMFRDYLALLGDTARLLATSGWRQRGRRLRFMLLWVAFWPTWIPFCWLCLGLDHLLFPGFRAQAVDRPLFVVGNLRTGSTFVQRLLSQPGCGYATFRTVDMLLPSVLQRRVMGLAGALDRALGAPGARLLAWAMDVAFAEFSRIHPMGLFQPEEDEFLFVSLLKSAVMYEGFPAVERFRRYLFPDALMPADELEGTLRWYHGLIQRQLYTRGPQLRFLAKNPLFTGKVSGLARAFPDARFVYLVRDPRAVVPSTASLLHFVWWNGGALPQGARDMDWVLALCRSYYGDCYDRLEALGPGRVATVRFEDLVLRPATVLGSALEALDLAPSPDLTAALERAQDQRGEHRSQHRYDLASWGLDETSLAEALPGVLERWGY